MACDNRRSATSEADGTRFGDHASELDRIHEGGVQTLEVRFRHPTGD
jgi:hypothetical protein